MTTTTPANPSRGMIPGWAMALIVILVLALGIGGCAVSVKNNGVTKDETAEKKWADVQSAYQRRADLIPNLVEVVKGYSDYEQETLTKVVEARAKATSITIDPSNITPEQLKQFQAAQDELGSAISRLLVTVERYPDLKANQNYLDLQSQLEGTENRINTSRNDYNEAVRDYNTFIRKFPNSLFASYYGFEKKGLFQAQAGSENAPKVDFSDK
ncbi:MAG: LemA family protein [Chitinophagales bacterium]